MHVGIKKNFIKYYSLAAWHVTCILWLILQESDIGIFVSISGEKVVCFWKCSSVQINTQFDKGNFVRFT